MSDFSDLMKEKFGPGSENNDQADYDLAALCALQHGFVCYDVCPQHMEKADDTCTDEDCVRAQPVFHAAKELQEKYQ